MMQHKYHHQCHDKDQYVDDIEEGNDYPGIPRECVKDPHCLVNTGDFRVVLADSHGDKIEEDLFGDLDEESISRIPHPNHLVHSEKGWRTLIYQLHDQETHLARKFSG